MTPKPRPTPFFARPELKEHLITLAGAYDGYSKWTEAQIRDITGSGYGAGYVNKIITAAMPASLPIRLALTRVAEQQPDMSNEEARKCMSKWFEKREA